jgi:hypothetical protein
MHYKLVPALTVKVKYCRSGQFQLPHNDNGFLIGHTVNSLKTETPLQLWNCKGVSDNSAIILKLRKEL